jgi:cysteine desulfurase
VIYLDHYRTTPISEYVVEKMLPYFRGTYFLPESFTQHGTEIAEVIDTANRKILNEFNLPGGDIFYTSGGTAANNFTISGILRDIELSDTHLVCSVIDHPSIVNVYEYYKKKGAAVTFLKVDSEGLLRPEELLDAIGEKTALISLTHTNHTIGAVQNLGELLPAIKKKNPKTLIHVDASMSINAYKLDLQKTPIDFLTFSAHKIYGPKGIGAVIMRKTTGLKPLLFGTVGYSPFAPGAENIPGIVGISEAIVRASQRRIEYVQRMLSLQRQLVERVENEIPEVVLNGPGIANNELQGNRVPDNINFSFRFVEGESIMMFLDFENILVATGSACASSDLKVNYVLSAIGRDHELAHGSLRITPGWENTPEHIDQLVDHLIPIVKRLRAQSTLR